MRGFIGFLIMFAAPCSLWADDTEFNVAYARAASSFDACKLSEDVDLQVEYYEVGMAALRRIAMIRERDTGLHDYMWEALQLGRDACEKRYLLAANRGPR